MTTALAPEPAPATSYVFADSGSRERDRLRTLATLMDPLHRRALRSGGLHAGLDCLEVGSGAGTMASWMAEQVGTDGHVVATDINLSFLEHLRSPTVSVCQLDVVADEMPRRAFDVVTCRALLHHLPQWESVVERLAGALKPNGLLALVEPDAGAAVLGDPEHDRFWSDWCRWGAGEGVDFRLGRKLPGAVQRAGLALEDVTMEIPFYTGGSAWGEFYRSTVRAAQPRMDRWDGSDLVAGFEALGPSATHAVCSFGWVAVCARAPWDAEAA
jgi:SAM-dependent methyltransferase